MSTIKKNEVEILNEMLARVTDSIDKREGSIIKTSLAPAAYFFSQMLWSIDNVEKNAFVDTATGSYLDMLCMLRGVARRPATFAVKEGSFNVEIPTGSRFSTIQGSSSLTYVSGDFIDKVGNLYKYKMTCQTAGRVGNDYVGNLLAISNISGLTQATLGTLITAGSDTETDESLRIKFYESLNEKAFAGNFQSYKDYLYSIDGIGKIQIHPLWKGGGTVYISCVDLNDEPLLPVKINEVQTLICPIIEDTKEPTVNGFGLAPIGASVTIGTATKVNIPIEAEIQLKVGYTLNQVTPFIKETLEVYFKIAREEWNKEIRGNIVSYDVRILLSQVISAIIQSEGVLNTRNVKINGDTIDIIMLENPSTQEIPFVGELLLTEFS